MIKDIVNQSQSDHYEYPDVFNDDVGLDITIPEIGAYTTPVWKHRDEGIRTVTVNIRTFIGTSPNAMHYYGTMDVDGVHMHCKEGAYITREHEKQFPLGAHMYTLVLTRPVTKKEIDNDRDRNGNLMWEFYRPGEQTNRFNTKSELIKLAKKVFVTRFTGNWNLVIDYGNQTRTFKLKDLMS